MRKVVKSLDIERYMGRWYQIAASQIPQAPPINIVDTRFTYTILDDNESFTVLYESWHDGKSFPIEGVASKVDPMSDEAKFKVKSKIRIACIPIPARSDFVVSYVDENYQFAVICLCQTTKKDSPSVLEILSRQSNVDNETYNELVEKARGAGYDVSNLRRTLHSAIPPESDGSKKIKVGCCALVGCLECLECLTACF